MAKRATTARRPKPRAQAKRRAKRLLPESAAFIATADPNVRATLADATPLGAFLESAAPLTADERALLVDQAIALIEGFYVHLPQKRAMYAIDPVQRLKLVARRARGLDDLPFHREMASTFTELRDLHTNYMLPQPYAAAIAFLPFVVQEYFDGDTRKYLLAHWIVGFSHPTFEPGVEITHWNGMPMATAIAAIADRNAGSNPDARRARGIDGLTIRPLVTALPPDEQWVIVGYVALDGTPMEYRADWLVFTPPPEQGSGAGAAGESAGKVAAADAHLGLDLATDAIRRARKALYVPHLVAAEARLLRRRNPLAGVSDAESIMPTVFQARTRKTSSGEFGYIGIRTFSVNDADAFVAEFMRLLALMPDSGLILDVRDNGGGLITAGEQLLQTLSPRTIEPQRLQFVATPQATRLVELNSGDGRVYSDIDLAPWQASLGIAPETGAIFSSAFPLSDPDACNAVGQKYFGRVVLLVNALCYSTTDYFIAGFRDHAIGTILGVDGNTGAGGANVWTHDLLAALFSAGNPPRPRPDSPFAPLPKGAGLRVAIRRSLRVGKEAGTVVEDLGVTPDDIHKVTRNDLLSDNAELYDHAGVMLAALPRHTIAPVLAHGADGSVLVSGATENLVRVDSYLDGRPAASTDVILKSGVDGKGEGVFAVTLPPPLTALRTLLLKGYDQAGDLAAARTLAL